MIVSGTYTAAGSLAYSRQRKREEMEALVQAQLRRRGSGWVTSRELACEIGYAYPGVARTLLRLAERGTVESQETTWVSSKSRIRVCCVFRLVEVKADYPAWLMPKAVVPVAGAGRVVRMEK